LLPSLGDNPGETADRATLHDGLVRLLDERVLLLDEQVLGEIAIALHATPWHFQPLAATLRRRDLRRSIARSSVPPTARNPAAQTAGDLRHRCPPDHGAARDPRSGSKPAPAATRARPDRIWSNLAAARNPRSGSKPAPAAARDLGRRSENGRAAGRRPSRRPCTRSRRTAAGKKVFSGMAGQMNGRRARRPSPRPLWAGTGRSPQVG
jgi:hypothetical protein